MRTRWSRTAVATALAAAGLGAGATGAQAEVKWLCKPGQTPNACAVGLDTTRFAPSGERLGVVKPKRTAKPALDCFYVYPTVSDQDTPQATKALDPEVRSIALYQAARYGQHCRIFAPVYRQLTIKAISGDVNEQARAIRAAYADVEEAFKRFLAKESKGRGFVLIGHSQGAYHLTELIRRQIDEKPAVRKRMAAAYLLGGNVLVRKGSDRGGSFDQVPACRTATQLGCVIGFSAFGQTPPADARFGRSAGRFASAYGGTQPKNAEVLCNNPAALGGGSANVDTIQPSAPFAPGTSIALGISILGFTLPEASTTFIEVPDAFSARCSGADGADVLRVAGRGQIPTPTPSPDATWGLHLIDANVALGNLVDVLRRQAKAYAAREDERR